MTDAPKTILILEDEKPLREALRDKLTLEGYAVLEAANGQEGLDIAFKEHPDLILMDVVMPVMDGLTVIEKLNQETWGQSVKIILLTNLGDNVLVTKAIGDKDYDYLVKSESKIEKIVELIRKKLA